MESVLYQAMQRIDSQIRQNFCLQEFKNFREGERMKTANKEENERAEKNTRGQCF